MSDHEVASEQQWVEARRALLAEEKAFTRERDRLSEKQRALPWVKVQKDYVFRDTTGPLALGDLFDGRRQPIVYHFMFGPDWQEGCPGCSLLCDQVDGARQHFEHNDVTFVAVSRGPIDRLDAYRRRMGWRFRWVSSAASDFNLDYHVSFPEGTRERGVFYNFSEQPDPWVTRHDGMKMTDEPWGRAYEGGGISRTGRRVPMITLSAFRWVPPFARGLVRDLRVRWALEEAGIPY